MIALLGANGYIGTAFVREFQDRGIPWKAIHREHYPLNVDCSNFKLVINCAVLIPNGSGEMCDKFPSETIRANTLLPQDLAEVCNQLNLPLAHVSTGCLWSDGLEHAEEDPPQRGFKGHCGFYIGSKIMSEQAVRRNCPNHYIWRVRLPFDEFDCSRNYISKVAHFNEVWDYTNTLCHRRDFVRGCLDLWELESPFGTYHVMNPGAVRASVLAQTLVALGIREVPPIIVPGPEQSSLVSVHKLLKSGVKMRSVEDALNESLLNWKPIPRIALRCVKDSGYSG